MPRIANLYRYPVKGLSADPLTQVTLEAGETLPFDRAWAIENGPSGFDPSGPKHLTKIVFLMLMRNERLAALSTRFDETQKTLTVVHNGKSCLQERLDTAEGRLAIETFFNAYSADDLRGPARLVHAPGHSFSDSADKVVSLINLETLRELGTRFGSEIHPLRFRGNLYVDDLPAWTEFDWVDREIATGTVRFQAIARIDRCAATNVNPQTAARDLTIPRSLLEAYGHADCGIYLKVTKGGELAAGAAITPV